MRMLFPMLAVALAGCQTAADVQASRDAVARQYLNLTMADFTRRTGLVPYDAVPTAKGKTFMVEGPTITVMTAPVYSVPGVQATATCRIALETVHVGAAYTADNWRIEALSWNGPCDSTLA